MATYNEVKQRFIDYLAEINLDKLNMMDLSVYSGILRTIYDTDRPDYMETLTKALSATSGLCACKSEVIPDGGIH